MNWKMKRTYLKHRKWANGHYRVESEQLQLNFLRICLKYPRTPSSKYNLWSQSLKNSKKQKPLHLLPKISSKYPLTRFLESKANSSNKNNANKILQQEQRKSHSFTKKFSSSNIDSTNPIYSSLTSISHQRNEILIKISLYGTYLLLITNQFKSHQNPSILFFFVCHMFSCIPKNKISNIIFYWKILKWKNVEIADLNKLTPCLLRFNS